MERLVPAVYEKGRLRFLEPVELEEGQVLQIPVPVEAKAADVGLEERLAAFERFMALASDDSLPPWPEIEAMIEGSIDDEIAGL